MDSLLEMSSRISAALLTVLVVLLVVPAVVAPVAGTTPSAPAPRQVTETPQPVEENTTLYLQLQPDGDARWTITDTYAFEDANDSAAFEELASSFAEGDTETTWLRSFREASTAASDATGREMNITGVERDYVTSDDRGQLILEFTWTNFATTEGERLVVGDAFNTTDGTWLRSLTDEQRLVISPPPGYGVRSVPTAVEGGDLRFEGPRTFEPGYLTIVYAGDVSSPSTTTPPPGDDPGAEFPFWLGGAALLVLGLVVAVGYIARQGYTDRLPSPGAESESGDATTQTPSQPTDSQTSEPAEDEVDVTLLSDEERVERLLEQNGGRMKQARIVKETGWSNAKVSQLLSAMDEDGRIDKLRIGRENLISFPDEEIGDFEQ